MINIILDIIQTITLVFTLGLSIYMYLKKTRDDDILAWQDLLELKYDASVEPFTIAKYIKINFHPSWWNEVENMSALDITIKIAEIANEPILFPKQIILLKYYYKKIKKLLLYYFLIIIYTTYIIA